MTQRKKCKENSLWNIGFQTSNSGKENFSLRILNYPYICNDTVLIIEAAYLSQNNEGDIKVEDVAILRISVVTKDLPSNLNGFGSLCA